MKNINPKKVFFGLLAIIAMLFVLHVTSFVTFTLLEMQELERFFVKTNFDREKNLPAIFSSINLFAASILLAVIGFTRLKISTIKTFWFILSVAFLFVGLDELLRIHEGLGNQISAKTEVSGIFYYSWIIPYGIAVLVLGIFVVKPLFKLPAETQKGFIVSAVIFLSGAVGMEMFTGWYVTTNNLENEPILFMPKTFVFYTIEELLEMIGVTYFIYVLLVFYKKYSIEEKTAFN